MELEVWLLGVDAPNAQALSRVAAGLGIRVRLATALPLVTPGAFVVWQCSAWIEEMAPGLADWLATDPQGLVWGHVTASADADVLLQFGATEASLLPMSQRMLLQRFRLLLEVWQRRRLECRERRRAEALRHERGQILEQVGEGVVVLDQHGLVLDANASALDWLAMSREQLLGRPVLNLLARPGVSDPFVEGCEHPLFHALGQAEAQVFDDTWLWRADGELLQVACRVAPLEAEGGDQVMLLFRDISVRKAEEALVDQLTRYDAITGLANAPLMRHFLLKAMARALRNDRLLAVLHVDLDDFGCISERFGRKAGNRLLRSVGRRLRGCIRTGDLVSRHHSDVFIVVLDEVRSPEDAEWVAQQMLARLNTPHDVGAQVVVHASIGLAFYPSGSIGIDTLMERAAGAAAWVKQNGKNHYRCFSEAAGERRERLLPDVH